MATVVKDGEVLTCNASIADDSECAGNFLLRYGAPMGMGKTATMDGKTIERFTRLFPDRDNDARFEVSSPTES